MSIELASADPTRPRRFHVRPNFCRCHAETCSHNDWAVHDPNGEKVTTFRREGDADKYTMQLRRIMWASQLSVTKVKILLQY